MQLERLAVRCDHYRRQRVKVHSLAFSNWISLFTLKTCKRMNPVFMVKMLLNLKLSIKCITFEFPPASMD